MANAWGTAWASAWASAWGAPVPGPSVYYQGDGDAKQRRGGRKKRRRFDELLTHMEATLRRLMAGDDPSVVLPETMAAASLSAGGLSESLAQLTAIAADYHDLSGRVEAIRREVVAYQAAQRAAQEEDDEEMMLVL